MPDMDCPRCAGTGAIVSDRIGRALRCSCPAGRVLAESQVASSLAIVADQMRRRSEKR